MKSDEIEALWKFYKPNVNARNMRHVTDHMEQIAKQLHKVGYRPSSQTLVVTAIPGLSVSQLSDHCWTMHVFTKKTVETSINGSMITFAYKTEEDIAAFDPDYIGTRCSICNTPQFNTEHGVSCINGHGGAPALVGGLNEG